MSLTSGVPEDNLRREPAPGDWPVDMVIAHLADAELVYSVRVRMMLTTEDPELPAYDQDRWADRFGGLDEHAQSSIARWRALRESNLSLFESVRDEEWRRTGNHEERGEITVADVPAIMADHDRLHLDQIRQALR